jgi:hypothetical protein
VNDMELESGSLRLQFLKNEEGWGFTSRIFDSREWRPGSRTPSRPLAHLRADACEESDGAVYLSGVESHFSWCTEICAVSGGFRLETTIHVNEPIRLNPAMILWLDVLDNLNDRQAHTWRQTVLRGPTVNQQGLGGNDLPACFLYDQATQTEAVCYFPPSAFAWCPSRFYEFSAREVIAYRPLARYGLGLVANGTETLFDFGPGDHTLVWWFTQRRREGVPSPWEAQRTMIEVLTPLLDALPTKPEHGPSWQEMADGTLHDLENEACWVDAGGRRSLRAYVKGSSAVGRDKAPSFELMTLLDVAWPLALWNQVSPQPAAQSLLDRLTANMPAFYRPAEHFIANNFPLRPGDTFMDTWYFLENALIKWPWVAHLTGDETLKAMFLDALAGATTLAHNTAYLFPLFADASEWRPRNSLLNVSVGGLYAAGHVLAHQMTGETIHLDEAANALRVMRQLPPHQLTHEPQQLTFAAAACRYLALQRPTSTDNFPQMASDLIYLLLRMGYWDKDPAVPYYDPRGMFQACASLSYPAFKENVESMLSWPELLRDGLGNPHLMAGFAHLQRHHNRAFFDAYLPEHLRRGPCSYIPYEDLATAEFSHTAELGKELYGAGEVFWSALLFDALGQVDDPHVLCLSLDVPCLELRTVPTASERRFLLYNPTLEERQVHLVSGDQRRSMTLAPQAIQYAQMTEGDHVHTL